MTAVQQCCGRSGARRTAFRAAGVPAQRSAAAAPTKYSLCEVNEREATQRRRHAAYTLPMKLLNYENCCELRRMYNPHCLTTTTRKRLTEDFLVITTNLCLINYVVHAKSTMKYFRCLLNFKLYIRSNCLFF